MSDLLICRASAGSGKTFRLAYEYLKLALSSAGYYKNILAVTFTNKASAEMKSRILYELMRLGSGKESPHLINLSSDLATDHTEIRKRASTVLEKILHDYSRFSVGTIDKFFQGVIRSFARETGLHAGYNIELDHKKVMEEIVDLMISESDINPELFDWLARYAESRMDEGKGWDFKKEICRLGEEIFREEFMQFDPDLLEKIHRKDFVHKYRSNLLSLTEKFEIYLANIGSKALEIISKHNLTIADFSYASSGVAGYFDKLASRSSFDPKSRPRTAIDNPESWCTAKSKAKEKILAAVSDGLNTLLVEAIEYYDLNFSAYNTAKSILKNIFSLSLLVDIAIRKNNYCNENNIFMLQDATGFIKKIIGANDAPFIYEKTGARYSNYMIDEFQDTSVLQWTNFKPLILNSLSENSNCMLVGDIKQAIYRWRNSDWGLLAGKINEDIPEGEIQEQILLSNWRSCKNIVDFNNSLFQIAPLILKNEFDNFIPVELKSRFADISENITGAYKETFQKVPEGLHTVDGFVRISFVKNEGGKEWMTEAEKQIPVLLELLQDKGYSLQEIAILVRKKDEGISISELLLQYKNDAGKEKYRYDTISGETLVIGNAPVVTFITGMLNYLISPNDRLNSTQVLYNYRMYIQPMTNLPTGWKFPYTAGQLLSETDSPFPAVLPSSCHYLLSLPVFDLIEEIIRIFGLRYFSGGMSFISALQDAVLEYCSRGNAGIDSFLEWWEEESTKRTLAVSEEQDAVRIFTIHKAKGLEFKVVIIPYCSWDIDHSGYNRPFLWCKTEGEIFGQIPMVPVDYSSSLINTDFREAYLNEKMKTAVDNLNLLYVALTRAEEAMFVFSPEPAGAEKPVTNTGELLYKCISENVNVASGIFERGVLEKDKSKDETDKGSQEFNISEYPSFDVSRLLKIYRRKSDEDIMGAGKSGRDFGEMMHRVFENIITMEDIYPAVKELVFAGELSESEMISFAESIIEKIRGAGVEHWFSGSGEVKREVSILLPDGKTKRPDRIMIHDDKVIVADYKFGKQNEKHHAQMADYLQLLGEMGYSNREGYIWYVDQNTVVRI